MSETRTQVLLADAAGIVEGARLLRAGRLVAFPTETVYGLGANALSAEAVGGIFRAKGRPAQDPLIVHLAAVDELQRVVSKVSEAARTLAAAFWPGPLTLVLPKGEAVPGIVTAGLDTVAVRVPSHRVAHSLIAESGLPIAAPSANRFTRPSPTIAEHVLEDLDGCIDLVLDGGPVEIGLESTIVDLSIREPRLLRPGGVPAEAIERVLGVRLGAPPSPAATGRPQPGPGLLKTHYAPRTQLVLVLGSPSCARARLVAELEAACRSGQRAGVLALTEDLPALPSGVVVGELGTWSDPGGSASRLFDSLRALDRAGLDLIFTRVPADPRIGLGRALLDRLRRAARRTIEAGD